MCLENIQDLDTLFKEWRKKHESEERGTRYTDTFPYKKDYTCSDDFNKSFCYDGFIAVSYTHLTLPTILRV